MGEAAAGKGKSTDVKQMKNIIPGFLCAVFVSLIGFTFRAEAQINPVLAAKLQAILDRRVTVSGNHGVSACVIMPDGALWKGTAGVGAGSLAITDTTVFHGASTIKANIATLILMLAEDGLLDLDSSWTKYVSLGAGFDPAITVRQLIGQRSGIADYLEIPATEAYVTTDFNRAFTPAEILDSIVSDVPDFAPGTDFAYSTSNYVLAAYIVEAVTGNPVQQELHSRIWDPLGMTHTYFGGFESYTEPRAGVWWNFGSGLTDYSSDPETSMLTYGYGGANIVSTPEDLAIFARALFTDSLLSPASMAEMQVFSPESYSTWCAGYGLGIHNAASFGTNSVLGHDGYFTNMTDMFHSFDEGFTLVTMSNTQKVWFAIFDEMYDTLLAFTPVGISEPLSSAVTTLLPNPATDEVTLFTHGHSDDAEVVITDVTGKLVYAGSLRGNTRHNIDISHLPEGMYLVQITTAARRETHKLVVTR